MSTKTIKSAKITQAQLRILRHKLQCKSQEARSTAKEEFRVNKERICAECEKIATRLLNKHRKALAGDITASVETWNTIQISPRLPSSSPAAEAYVNAVKKEIEKAGLNGITDQTEYVYVPSLGLTGDHHNGCLHVPATQKAKWQALADEIDGAFMGGDAASLLDILNKFNI